MGASLGCCGGPSDDYDLSMLKTARYHPMMGRCDDVEKSLLRKLQRSISTSWTTARQDTRSPHAASLVSSRYALDYESESDTEEPSGIDSNASVTSGSRLLCDFYNLVLECDHSKFFVDANGRRIKGAYLTQIDILEDYFAIARRQLGNSRRRRRSSMDEREALAYQPPHKLKSSSDRSSAMSLLSSDSTSQTLTSESDYWATFMDSAEDNSYFSRQSVERRRSWVLHDMSMYASSLSDTTILFSPVNTDSVPSSSARPRSSSRNSFRSPHHHKPTPSHPVVPIEGHHQHNYNLWTREENQNKPSVPNVFSAAAVNERRRASLSMGSSTTVNGHNASRRMSLQTVAPVAAS